MRKKRPGALTPESFFSFSWRNTSVCVGILAAAAGLGAVPMYVYALLLFAGMFGSALSNAVAFVNYCCAKLAPLRARKAAFTVLTVLLAYLASLFGFGSLIGTLYPLFGYASALFLVLMLLHAVLLFRRKTP